MLSWIAENAISIIVTAILLGLIGIAVFSLVKDKKSNRGGCTGNCATCGMGCSYSTGKRSR